MSLGMLNMPAGLVQLHEHGPPSLEIIQAAPIIFFSRRRVSSCVEFFAAFSVPFVFGNKVMGVSRSLSFAFARPLTSHRSSPVSVSSVHVLPSRRPVANHGLYAEIFGCKVSSTLGGRCVAVVSPAALSEWNSGIFAPQPRNTIARRWPSQSVINIQIADVHTRTMSRCALGFSCVGYAITLFLVLTCVAPSLLTVDAPDCGSHLGVARANLQACSRRSKQPRASTSVLWTQMASP